MTIANYSITSSIYEEIRVAIDSEVALAKDIGNLCLKTDQKLHALVSVANFITLEKCRLVMKILSSCMQQQKSFFKKLKLVYRLLL